MTDNTSPAIGGRLRHAREARQLSLAAVAERTQLSKGFLSKVERDETSPSVASLIAICDAVGIPMASLFTVPQVQLVRVANRPQATLPGALVIDTLITPSHETKMTVIETMAAPSGSSGVDLYSLASECELALVLEGLIEITIENKNFELGPGDALTFGAAVPHRWRNCSDTESARIIWVLAPALPDPQSHALPPLLGD